MGGYSGINVDVGSGPGPGSPWTKGQQPRRGPGVRPGPLQPNLPAGSSGMGMGMSPAPPVPGPLNAATIGPGGSAAAPAATPSSWGWGPLTASYTNTSNANDRNNLATMATQDQANQNKALNSTTPVLSEAMNNANPDAVRSSPFYNALKNQAIESTSAAYDNERANSRARANASGFGYASPVAQGAEAEIGAREAGALAQAPERALLETPGFIAQTEAPGLQAANITSGEGAQYGNEAAQLFGNATSSDMNRQRLEMEKLMQSKGLKFDLYKQWLAGAQSGAAAAAGG